MNDPALIMRAAAYATEMHGDQKRKYTGEPYVCHCFDVAGIVSHVTVDHTMIAAAILHDTVEDTTAEPADIDDIFGTEVGNLVQWLTDVSQPSDGNRAARKRLDRDHIAMAPVAAKTIKLADLISNTRSIVSHDPGFARTYLREKEQLLIVLRDGDPTLWQKASALLRDGMRRLAS